MSYTNTFRVSQYAPANETAHDIWSEVCNLNGTILAAVAYGVHATLFFSCIVALWDRREKPRAKARYNTIFIIYVCIHFILGSFAFAFGTKFNEMMFITNRDFPGGPNGYFIANQGSWARYMEHLLYFITACLQDALLIYRYWVFWNRNKYMLIIPVCLYVVSIVVGVLLLMQLKTPYFNVFSVDLFTTFWAVEVTTTIFLTSLIVGRLLYMRHLIRKAVGPKHEEPYLSIAAMLVESGIMFSVGGLITVISQAYNSPFQNLVITMVGQIQSIAPVLIILRVARGNSITKINLESTPSAPEGAECQSTPLASLRTRPNQEGAMDVDHATHTVALSDLSTFG